MYKNVISILMVVLTTFLCGCNDLGISDAIALDENEHISFEHLGNDRIEFQGNIYYLSPINFLWGNEGFLKNEGNCKYIGWSGARFGYKSFVFGDSADNPTFLYFTNTSSTYLIESFDYKNETFNIEETKESFVFCDNLLPCDEKAAIFGVTCSTIIISSSVCPPLKMRLSIFNEGDQWYAASSNMVKFRLTEHFVNILDENNLLNNN